MQGFTKNKDRLSDRILFAVELALQQQDLEPAKQQVLDQLYEYAEMVVPQE